MTNYFNTTNETGADLKKNEAHNLKQNDLVLRAMSMNKVGLYTPRHIRINTYDSNSITTM